MAQPPCLCEATFSKDARCIVHLLIVAYPRRNMCWSNTQPGTSYECGGLFRTFLVLWQLSILSKEKPNAREG